MNLQITKKHEHKGVACDLTRSELALTQINRAKNYFEGLNPENRQLLFEQLMQFPKEWAKPLAFIIGDYFNILQIGIEHIMISNDEIKMLEHKEHKLQENNELLCREWDILISYIWSMPLRNSISTACMNSRVILHI